jgi:membrane protease YdiL (CAAX protease family)
VSQIEREVQRPTAAHIGAWQKVAAVVEIVGMLAVANAILWYLEPILHIPQLGPLLGSVADGASVDPWYLGGVLLLHLTLRGAIFVVVVLALDRILGRRDRYRHGLSLAGQSLVGLLFAGLLAACVAGLPVKCFAMAAHFHLLRSSGGSEAYMFLRNQWGPGFWFLYVLAMCVVVPFHEEFFFRGYAQRRLEGAFGAAGAIFLGALFFTLQHLREYLYNLSAPNLAQLLCMAFDAMVLGNLFWRTRSLLPCILVHAAGNAPLRGFSINLTVTLVMVLALIVFLRTWLRHASEFFRQLQIPDGATMTATCLLVAGMVTFELFGDRIIWPYFCGLLATLYLEPKRKVAVV